MLFRDIFRQRRIKEMLIKFIYISIIVTIISTTFLGIMSTNVNAAQYTEKYVDSDSLKNYPGYSTLIETLKKAHPNWTFTILYTGLDWNTVIKNETTVVHGRNLITGSKTGEWVCPTCSDTRYDNGSWKCASEATVAYYMDPRNSLFEDYIFQFENLKWVDGVYTIAGINSIIADCKYMQGSKITYTATDGTKKTINKSYSQVILEAAQENNISAYHLAARIRQEQGAGTSPSSTATGTYTGYKGYYNYFNVNAYGSGSATIIKNALSYAKTKGWTDPEKAIKGGASFVANEYINDGQSTLYLQKFDVDSSDGSLYWHQYMQNVSAAKSEGSTILNTYKKIDSTLSSAFNFIIPVYKNMPEVKCPQPGSYSIVTQNIQVTDNEVVVRTSRNVTADIVTKLKKNDKVLRIEIGNTKTNGYYWDKVVLPDGRKGYIVASGIKLLADITNCNIRALAVDPGNVRNGPGTSGTTVITTLTVGQNVTIIEKNVYKDVDGYDWSRIYLSDGRQGYIVARYLEEIPDTPSNEQTTPSGKELVKVVASSLAVREKPGTDQEIYKYAERGDILTRIDKEVSTKNGYIWDQVITDDGIEGYVARGDSDGAYIQTVKSSTTEIKAEGIKTTGTNVVCKPKMTIANIIKAAPDAVIKNANGEEVKSGKIGTGYTIKYGGQTYTAVALGDTNGDGEVKSTDYMRIKNYIMSGSKLTAAQKLAADVNNDGQVKSTDYMRIKNYIMGSANIDI